jgi:hypothetical protein
MHDKIETAFTQRYGMTLFDVLTRRLNSDINADIWFLVAEDTLYSD